MKASSKWESYLESPNGGRLSWSRLKRIIRVTIWTINNLIKLSGEIWKSNFHILFLLTWRNLCLSFSKCLNLIWMNKKKMNSWIVLRHYLGLWYMPGYLYMKPHRKRLKMKHLIQQYLLQKWIEIQWYLIRHQLA